jgi:O-antigen/teichoic acid export membrane protein
LKFLKKNTDLIVHHLFWRVLYFFSILLINIGIARFFAAAQSGHLFFIVSNLSLILLVVSLSLESGAAYYIASGKLDSLSMARFCLLWALGASTIALGAWWILLQIAHSGSLSRPDWLFPAFLFIAGVLLTTYFTALFYARKEFGLPNQILFAVNLLLIFLMIMGKNQSGLKNHFILIYFSCFFLQGLLVCLFFFAKHRGTQKPFFPSRSIIKKVFRYSLIALLANGLFFLVNRIDYWFVQYFCSPIDLGNYIQASKLGQMLLVLPSILGSTLFPIFSSGEKTGNNQDLSSVIRILLWFNLIICSLILCIGWAAFPWIFGPSFNKMYVLFVLLIPGILAFTMNYPLAAWFSGGDRMATNIRGTLIALVIICAGDLLTIPALGVWFASIFSSAGYFCYFGYTLKVYRSEHPVPWKDFLVIRKSDFRRIRESVNHQIRSSRPEKAMAPKQIL